MCGINNESSRNLEERKISPSEEAGLLEDRQGSDCREETQEPVG